MSVRPERRVRGHDSGPQATVQGTAAARKKAATARALVIVEGISDQIALETLAVRLGRDLDTERVVVMPVGGAHAATPFLREFGPRGAGLTLTGLYDAGEEDAIRRAVTAADLGMPQSRSDLAVLGFHVCEEDLEDELIRAAGTERVEALFESQADLSAFRSLQRQPAWRGAPVEKQMRRFLGAGSGRKLRYAQLLVEAIAFPRLPFPLVAALGKAVPTTPPSDTPAT